VKGKKVVPIWRKEDRAEHIYRVTAEIMCEKGYEATSMSDIADAVGLTKAGVYHYISGKQQLLFEIMSFAMDKVEQEVVRPARLVADPEERLRLIVSRHSRRILESGGAVTIVLEEMAALARPHYGSIRNRKRAYYDLVRQTLEELQAAGRLRDIDPTSGAFTVLGMINWVARWYRREGRLGPDAVLGDMVTLTLGAVLKPADCTHDDH
jgi:AcrR family transcriptional regulator